MTGETADLAYVSPKSGRAVSAAAAGPWRERLLALPAFLIGEGGNDPVPDSDIRQGLALTGWFLERYVYSPQGRQVPAARLRLVEGF